MDNETHTTATEVKTAREIDRQWMLLAAERHGLRIG
jgi:hypothetical protein